MLLVSTVDSDPAHTDAEGTLIRRLHPDLSPHLDLVLLHGARWRLPCDCRRWLDARQVTHVHHVRQWQAEDFAGLARIVPRRRTANR